MSSARPSPGDRAPLVAVPLLRLAVPLGMLLAVVATQRFTGDQASAAETLFLAFWAAAVFAPLAFLDVASGPAHAGFALATTVAVAALPRSGGLRPAVVAALLTVAVVVLTRLELRRRSPVALRSAAALSLAAAFVLHGHRLWIDGLSLATAGLLVLLPGLAAAAATGLAVGGRPGAGLAAAFALVAAPQLATEPWWIVLACAATASLAGLGGDAPARFARRALLLLGGATLLAGSYPWLRAAPIATLAASLASLAHPVVDTPLAERAVVLTRASPTFEAELSGGRVGALVLDSYLTHGVDLPCGQPLATVTLDDRRAGEEARKLSKGAWSGRLAVGRDSAEWAAGRPDVAARLACSAPPPWISWIPSDGRFLGQTTRSRLALPFAHRARTVRIERDAALPEDTALALFFVATER